MDEKTIRLTPTFGQARPLKVTCGAWTRAGADPSGRQKNNQDAWAVKEYLSGSNTIFFGVFDGHGGDGQKVSRMLSSKLPSYLANCAAFQNEQYREAMVEQFPLCNKDLLKATSINCNLSGSTAITALLQGNGKLLVGNVGDSRCMLGRLGAGGKLTSISLNTDHNPEVPEEADRIRANKGRLGSYCFNGQNVGPKRVWLASQNIPGLSMTRSFGDSVAASVGVIAEPEVREITLTPEDKYLVLCSDGLFEFMDNDYILSLVHRQASRGWNPTDIAKFLAAEARRQWMDEEEGIIDDITAIVIFLDVPPAAPEAAKRTKPPPMFQRSSGSVSKDMHQIARYNTHHMPPSSFNSMLGGGVPDLHRLSIRVPI